MPPEFLKPAHNRGMTNTMRRIHTLRTAVNVSAAVLLLIITTITAAQIAGVPDPVLFGGGDDGVGILTVVTILGVIAVVFGTPVVLAVNIFHWASTYWFRRREHGRATRPVGQGPGPTPEEDRAPSALEE